MKQEEKISNEDREDLLSHQFNKYLELLFKDEIEELESRDSQISEDRSFKQDKNME